MTTKVIPLYKNYTSYCLSDETGNETGALYKSGESLSGEGVEFTIKGQTRQTRGTRFVLNFWDANCVGRDVTAGPVSQRASASFSAQATVLYAGPRRPECEVVEIEFGDLIVCPELDLVGRVVPGGPLQDPKLELLSYQPATRDYSALVAAENAKPRRYVSESYLSG